MRFWTWCGILLAVTVAGCLEVPQGQAQEGDMRVVTRISANQRVDWPDIVDLISRLDNELRAVVRLVVESRHVGSDQADTAGCVLKESTLVKSGADLVVGAGLRLALASVNGDDGTGGKPYGELYETDVDITITGGAPDGGIRYVMARPGLPEGTEEDDRVFWTESAPEESLPTMTLTERLLVLVSVEGADAAAYRADGYEIVAIVGEDGPGIMVTWSPLFFGLYGSDLFPGGYPTSALQSIRAIVEQLKAIMGDGTPWGPPELTLALAKTTYDTTFDAEVGNEALAGQVNDAAIGNEALGEKVNDGLVGNDALAALVNSETTGNLALNNRMVALEHVRSAASCIMTFGVSPAAPTMGTKYNFESPVVRASAGVFEFHFLTALKLSAAYPITGVAQMVYGFSVGDFWQFEITYPSEVPCTFVQVSAYKYNIGGGSWELADPPNGSLLMLTVFGALNN